MIFAFVMVLAVLLFSTCAVGAVNIPCEKIRAGVAQYGYVQAVAWARAQGYSEALIRQAKTCLIKVERER